MNVVMPQIGMTMQGGAIAEWLKDDGARVTKVTSLKKSGN